jgi:hypothetical protein
LLAWLPFFFFNIFGEELWWRGYIQPRQELLTKRYTWLVHGALWSLFHIGIGWSVIFLALPNFFILPFSSTNKKKYYDSDNHTHSIWFFRFSLFGVWFCELKRIGKTLKLDLLNSLGV